MYRFIYGKENAKDKQHKGPSSSNYSTLHRINKTQQGTVADQARSKIQALGGQ